MSVGRSLGAGSDSEMVGKSWNRFVQTYETAIKTFYDHGIMICGTFVFGYDHDTPESFERCVEFTLRWKLFLAHFNLLIPYPGTTLYARLQREGRLINDPWWLNPQFQYGQATFHPRGMTAEELTYGCFWARKQVNSLSSIVQRAIHPQANGDGDRQGKPHGKYRLRINVEDRGNDQTEDRQHHREGKQQDH